MEYELGRAGISVGTEFIGRIVRGFEVYYRRTNCSDGNTEGYFEDLEDAENLIKQLPGYPEIREVLLLSVDGQFVLLGKMEKIELQPSGSVPYLSSEELFEKRNKRISNLIKDFGEKMSNKDKNPLLPEDKRKLSPEELQFILENIGQGPE